MAITREQKEELIAQYAAWIGESEGIILLDYRGLSVPQTENLRGRIREAGGRYHVCKNTLFKRALKEQEWPESDDLLVGPTAVAFAHDNYPVLAKTLLNFQEQLEGEETFVIKGGLLLGEELAAERIQAISALPSHAELRAQLLGLILAPAQNLVNVLNAATSSIVNVLEAHLQENEAA